MAVLNGAIPDIEASATIEPRHPANDGPKSQSSVSLQLSDSDNVVVISFRALQLQRIADLQDNLFALSALAGKKDGLTETEKTDIDVALANYGKS
jgi:hypothetical protein